MVNENNFYSRLYAKFVSGRLNKYYYFMWKNKLNNTKMDFSIFSEEEFIEKYLKESSKMNGLKMWESTTEYQDLMVELYEFKMNQDFYKLYETYLTKAMNGEEKALNALKTIKKEIESLNKPKSRAKVEEETNFDMKQEG